MDADLYGLPSWGSTASGFQLDSAEGGGEGGQKQELRGLGETGVYVLLGLPRQAAEVGTDSVRGCCF